MNPQPSTMSRRFAQDEPYGADKPVSQFPLVVNGRFDVVAVAQRKVSARSDDHLYPFPIRDEATDNSVREGQIIYTLLNPDDGYESRHIRWLGALGPLAVPKSSVRSAFDLTNPLHRVAAMACIGAIGISSRDALYKPEYGMGLDDTITGITPQMGGTASCYNNSGGPIVVGRRLYARLPYTLDEEKNTNGTLIFYQPGGEFPDGTRSYDELVEFSELLLNAAAGTRPAADVLKFAADALNEAAPAGADAAAARKRYLYAAARAMSLLDFMYVGVPMTGCEPRGRFVLRVGV